MMMMMMEEETELSEPLVYLKLSSGSETEGFYTNMSTS